MNYRRVAAAAVAAWLVSVPLGAFLHHGALGHIYAADASAFRPDAGIVRRLPIGYSVGLLGFLAVAFIYAEKDSRQYGIAEGIRFGLLLGIALVSLAVIWNYVTQPISASVGIAEISEYIVASIAYGAVIGVVYRPLASVER